VPVIPAVKRSLYKFQNAQPDIQGAGPLSRLSPPPDVEVRTKDMSKQTIGTQASDAQAIIRVLTKKPYSANTAQEIQTILFQGHLRELTNTPQPKVEAHPLEQRADPVEVRIKDMPKQTIGTEASDVQAITRVLTKEPYSADTAQEIQTILFQGHLRELTNAPQPNVETYARELRPNAND
jgi:hypothetical protein